MSTTNFALDADNYQSTATQVRAVGGPALLVASASGLPVPTGSQFVRLTVARGTPATIVTTLKVTGVNPATGTLAVAGPIDGYADAAVEVGDAVYLGCAMGTLDDIQGAINALETTVSGLGTAFDAAGSASAVSTTLTAAIALKAPLASPAFTGTPAAPTPATSDNSTTLATTAYVKAQPVLAPANNLSDVASAATARANLGLGTAATHAATDFLSSGSTISGSAVSGNISGNAAGITGTVPSTQVTGLGTAATLAAGSANGVATLDGTGKVPSSQIPAAIVNGLEFAGLWNAATNSPALASGTGTKGTLYKVSTAGTTTLDGVSSWNAGDLLFFDGSTWDKIDGTASEVLSVAGRTGNVTLSPSDVSGLAASATTDTTNAGNISAGTLPASRLPVVGLTLASYNTPITAATYASTTTFDLSQANKYSLVLTGSPTLALSNVSVGQQFTIILQQDSTGSRTVTWFSGILWPGGTAPTLSTAANKRDVFSFLCVSSGVYLGFTAGQAF